MAERILLVDDDMSMLRLLSMRLAASGYEVSEAENAQQARQCLAMAPPRVVISDIRLPDGDGLALFDEIHAHHPVLPVILITAHGSIADAVTATARGVFGYLTKPCDGQVLLDKVAQALAVAPQTQDEAGAVWNVDIVSRSARMAELLAEARLVAAGDACVLIRGESGTGKELLARTIHCASPRARQPFIAVNCADIPGQLLRAELFGQDAGAGAARHPGLFQAAQGGTLFLDEIAEMPLTVQVALLRQLEEADTRNGGPAHAARGVRIISATNRDLEAALAEGRFREDLYYRLNVVPLLVPALEQRREDIPLLATHFLTQFSGKYRKRLAGFAPDALEALVTAPWPGNVRQLYNAVEQVCALATGPLVPLALVQRALRSPTLQSLTYVEAKARFERDYLVQLLKLTDGNVADAAKLTNRNRSKFYSLLQRHGLTPGSFRDARPQMTRQAEA